MASFILPRVVQFGSNFTDWCTMTCRLRWYGGNWNQMQNSNIWRTFGQIQWHIIPEPPATLQGAATGLIQWHVIPEPHITLQGACAWLIYCHDSTSTCHIAGCSLQAKSMSWSCNIAGFKNSIRLLIIVFRHIGVWALTSGGFRIVSDTLVM